MEAIASLVGMFHAASIAVVVGLVAFSLLAIFLLLKVWQPDWDGN
jgi:tetrahydromethanopterin S-methyltransferase subunit B